MRRLGGHLQGRGLHPRCPRRATRGQRGDRAADEGRVMRQVGAANGGSLLTIVPDVTTIESMAIRRLVVIVVVVLATGGVSARDGEPGSARRWISGRGASAALLPPGRTLVCKLPSAEQEAPRHRAPRPRRPPAAVPGRRTGHAARARSRATRARGARVGRPYRRLAGPAGRGTAGYGTRTAARKPGDRSVRYFHSERHQEPRGAYDLRPTPSEGPDLRERTGTASRPRRRDVEHARRRGRTDSRRPDSPLALARRVQGGRERGLTPPRERPVPAGPA